MGKDVLVDYDVVSEFAGHQGNKGVKLVDAAKDIFGKAKEKAMQVAVKGNFIQFTTVDELASHLEEAVKEGYSIRVFDEIIGG